MRSFTTSTAAVVNTKHSVAAALTFLIYDQFLTFDDEVEYVWRRPRSLGKALFIFNRYFALFSLIFEALVFFLGSLTNNVCQKFFYWEAVSTIVVIVSAEIILVARIYAVYDCNKCLLRFLMGLGGAEFMTSLVAELISLPKMPAATLPRQTGCYVLKVPSYTFIAWIPALIVEATLLSLMLYKAWKLFGEGGRFPLLRLLIRDSILYFSTNIAILLLNCFIWAFNVNHEIIVEVVLGWAIAIPCAMVSRLLLNMRRRYYTEQETLGFGNERSREGIHLSSLHMAVGGRSWVTSTQSRPPGLLVSTA
ncbi:hypothetical protein K439DRAFT_1661809 [Ramaria rubella]|nr:hypothetical protein K439DRAFT_1661809 [Ramaria rubella]